MSTNITKKILDNRILIKYVGAAKMWCKTTFVDGKQKQEWFMEKPIVNPINSPTTNQSDSK